MDIVIIEIGGTVGDIESLPFLEAMRQLRFEIGRERCISVHVTLVPYIGAAGELKTKPTQHSVMKLRGIGIQPDILLCRSAEQLGMKKKIALFTNVPARGVLGTGRRLDLQGAARVRPGGRRREDPEALRHRSPPPEMTGWERVVQRVKAAAERCASRWSASTSIWSSPTRA